MALPKIWSCGSVLLMFFYFDHIFICRKIPNFLDLKYCYNYTGCAPLQ